MYLDYFYFSSKFSADFVFKSLNIDESKKCFEKNFSKLNRWGLCDYNQKFGILNKNGSWSMFNLINTNSSALAYLYNYVQKYEKIEDKYFNDPLYKKYLIKKVWELIDTHFNDIFDEKKEPFIDLCIILSNSWTYGTINEIEVILRIYNEFPNIKIEYSFMRGNVYDWNGRDILTEYDNEKKTYQIKSGKWFFDGDNYIITGAQNNLQYVEDYYAYANIDELSTDVIIFENKKPELTFYNNTPKICVPKELVYLLPKKNYKMNISTKLYKLHHICGNKKIIFEIINDIESPTSIKLIEEDSLQKLILNINSIADDESKNILIKLIDDKINELE